MPFRSEKQKKWMYANMPQTANKWQEHTPKGKKLPMYADDSSENYDALYKHFSHMVGKEQEDVQIQKNKRKNPNQPLLTEMKAFEQFRKE